VQQGHSRSGGVRLGGRIGRVVVVVVVVVVGSSSASASMFV